MYMIDMPKRAGAGTSRKWRRCRAVQAAKLLAATAALLLTVAAAA
jgi:hypothetical protein